MPRPRANSTDSEGDAPSGSLRAPSALKNNKSSREVAGPLQRGSACLNCRKRKLKCDAGKPACQQCIRANSESECSYDNGKALSKTQILQQRIAQLEAKLSALQGRNSSSSAASPGGSPPIDPPSRSNQPQKDGGANGSSLDPFGASSFVAVRTLSRSPSVSGPNLYDTTLGPADYGSSTIAPSLISTGARMSPYLSTGVDLYDPSAPWPNSAGGDDPSSLQTAGQIRPDSLFPSPSASAFNLNDTPDLLPSTSSGSLSKSNSSLGSSSMDFRTSLRSMADPNCITATEQGRQYLLSIFLPVRQRYYFDVHIGRFLESVHNPDPRKQPHPCLMDAIYLLACYISRDESIRQYEAGLLSAARQGLCDSLEHSDRLWNFVQASTLIAFYLYQNGRFIEAYHQTCQVARFAVSCGLHQISSPFMPDPNSTQAQNTARTQAPWTVTNMSVRRAGSMLEPPKDQIEVGERILAFWHIFLLDRCGSIMTNLPAALPDECDSFSQIETVWPRTLDEYDAGEVFEADYGTVRYLYHHDSQVRAGRADTIFTLRLKASALFERASRLGARYSATMSEQLFNLFRAVDFAISRFSQTVPFARNTGIMGEIPPPLGVAAPVNAQLVFVHTLALTATMRLHYLAAKDDQISYDKRMRAADATVEVANELMGSNVDYAEFDMLLGYCWKTACDVFIMERQITVDPVRILALESKIDTLVGHMQTLQAVFPLTVFQVTEVINARAAAVGATMPAMSAGLVV